ncbi:ankyrin [Polychaeton citri CBS 116435]|uniref:Ankyrin n=1 Tax=Polychaeton citri CBS 116435 TaxID=1314669 RepID=A0A9P4PW47_9PEZI|nr:ankyrin [Polychaeton citri CBS 116435]
MKMLKFDQMDTRHDTIKANHRKTCRWLLQRSEYLDWRDAGKISEHHGFLWIKGKPGTGKSTIMKYAFTAARKGQRNSTVISYFFNARGEDLEKTVEGMYRSLLLQLLEKIPALQSIFDATIWGSYSLPKFTIEVLKDLFSLAIKSLGRNCLACFIDALDECNINDLRDMVAFFEDLGEQAIAAGVRFSVCFSSRHYPHVTIKRKLELFLEGQEGHKQDIESYIESELKIGSSARADQIRAEIRERAADIFLWVALVVQILNKEYDRGHIHALQRRLREIPDDLNELFKDILRKDEQDPGLIPALQWILYSRRPLKCEELYFAILSSVALSEVTAWDPVELTLEEMSKFILDCSKGLAEMTRSKQPTFQFIHESVRDYLIQETGLQSLKPELKGNLVGLSHEHLKQCCYDYVLIDWPEHLRLIQPLPKASSKEAENLRNTLSGIFPFLEYAVHSVFYHADTAHGCGVSQTAFIKGLQDSHDTFLTSPPLEMWIILDNLLETFQIRRHTLQATGAYIFAEKSLSNLLEVAIEQDSPTTSEAERYCTPLGAAIAQGNEREVEFLLKRGADPNRRIGKTSFLHLGIQKRNVNVVRLLLQRGADLSLDRQEINILAHLSSAGTDTELVKVLLDAGVSVNAQGGRYGNALQAASSRGNEKMVQMLLDNGADVNAQGGLHGNALQAASSEDEKVVQMLLDNDADVNAQGGLYGNALQAAFSRGNEKVVHMLLDKGTDANAL